MKNAAVLLQGFQDGALLLERDNGVLSVVLLSKLQRNAHPQNRALPMSAEDLHGRDVALLLAQMRTQLIFSRGCVKVFDMNIRADCTGVVC